MKRVIFASAIMGMLIGCGSAEIQTENSSKRFKGDKQETNIITADENIERDGLFMTIPLPQEVQQSEETVADEAIEDPKALILPPRKSNRLSIKIACLSRGVSNGSQGPKQQDDEEPTSTPNLALTSIMQAGFTAKLITYTKFGAPLVETVGTPVYCDKAAVKIHINQLKSNEKYQLSAVYNTGFTKYTGETETFSLKQAYRTKLVMTRVDRPTSGNATISVIFKEKPDQPAPTVCLNNFQWLYQPLTYAVKAGKNSCEIEKLKGQGYLTLQEFLVRLRIQLAEDRICTQELGMLTHPKTKHAVTYTNGCHKRVLKNAGFTENAPLATTNIEETGSSL